MRVHWEIGAWGPMGVGGPGLSPRVRLSPGAEPTSDPSGKPYSFPCWLSRLQVG